jgi:hypothetical protein
MISEQVIKNRGRWIFLIGAAALASIILVALHFRSSATTPPSPPKLLTTVPASASESENDPVDLNGAHIRTDRRVYPEPPLPGPLRAGDKFIDPVFGTQIMRATDDKECPPPGCGTFYSQWPTFNADNTRLLIRKGASGEVLIKEFDPVNFVLGQTLRRSPTLQGRVALTWEGATWSGTDPDLIFLHVNYYDASYPATGMKLYSYRPSSNQFRLIKDFGPQLAPGKPDYLFEMHIAQNGKDDIFTFLHKRVGLSEPIKIIVWKRSTDTVLQHLAINDSHLPPQGANAALPDKSGRWIFFPSNGVPVASEMRVAVLDLSNNTWQGIYWTGADDSVSHADLGTGTLVGHGQFSGAATIRSLSDVHRVVRLFDYKDTKGVTDWSNDQHTSMYADDESWAMMSLYDESDVFETGAFENEVMQFSTSNPNKFRRLFHHRSQIDNLTPTTGYWALPKATITHDGRYIAFTSNWEKSGRYDLYIARIEPPATEPGSAQRITAPTSGNTSTRPRRTKSPSK